MCGGLWHASYYPGMPSEFEVHHLKVRVVVAHCNKTLKWMSAYLKDFNVLSTHVMSKCGVEVEGVPENAIVEVLQNVGRNDHSYAHYITSVLPTIAPRVNSGENSVVVFLKDSMMDIIHQGRRFSQLDLATLIRLSSSENQFSCGLGVVDSKMSAYHDKATLSSYTIMRYIKGNCDYESDSGVSKYKMQFSYLKDMEQLTISL
jgi:hypothetical protein